MHSSGTNACTKLCLKQRTDHRTYVSLQFTVNSRSALAGVLLRCRDAACRKVSSSGSCTVIGGASRPVHVTSTCMQSRRPSMHPMSNQHSPNESSGFWVPRKKHREHAGGSGFCVRTAAIPLSAHSPLSSASDIASKVLHRDDETAAKVPHADIAAAVGARSGSVTSLASRHGGLLAAMGCPSCATGLPCNTTSCVANITSNLTSSYIFIQLAP
jgi:hypothetical protein